MNFENGISYGIHAIGEPKFKALSADAVLYAERVW